MGCLEGPLRTATVKKERCQLSLRNGLVQTVINQQEPNMEQMDSGWGEGRWWYLFHSVKHNEFIKCWSSGSLIGTWIPFSWLLPHGQKTAAALPGIPYKFNAEKRKEGKMVWRKKIVPESISFVCRGKPFTSLAKTVLCGHLLAAKVKSESEVAQSCPTLCNPLDCSLPGPSVHGILQAGTLAWVATSFSGDLPHPGIKTVVSNAPLQFQEARCEVLSPPLYRLHCPVSIC